MDNAFRVLGVRVIHTGLNPFRIIKTLFDLKPNLIQTWLYHSDLIGSLIGKLLLGIPVIWGVHHTTLTTNSVKSSTYLVVRLLAKMSSSFPERIICCSRSAYDSHKLLGYDEGKMLLIENGIDTSSLRVVPDARQSVYSELGLSDSDKTIGMFARFNPQKDHKTFVEAAGRLALEKSDVHFILGGEMIDKNNDSLKGWIESNAMQGRFHLVGPRHDIPRYLSAMDLVTLTSAFGEALPMILLEAVCCGAPCVATDVGDISFLLEGWGIVVTPGDAEALAAGWAKVLEWTPQYKNEMLTKARDTVETRYGVEKMSNNYHNAYLEIKK
jgi:glycosyltransferase involved in cell wall biosynthesis